MPVRSAARPDYPKAAPTSAAAGTGATSLTADDVTRMVQDQIGGLAAAGARATYIGTKMADLPEAYRNQMPATADPVALAAAEQDIRSQFRKDFAVQAPFHAGYASIAGQTSDRGPANMNVHAMAGRAQAAADAAFAAGDRNAGQPGTAMASGQPSIGDLVLASAVADRPSAIVQAAAAQKTADASDAILRGLNQSQPMRSLTPRSGFKF